MIQFSDQDYYCQGKHNTQSKKKIEYMCINLECSLDHFCCKKCEKDLHNSHRQDCVDLEEFDEQFSRMLKTQNDLIKRLKDFQDSFNSRISDQIEQLKQNVTQIESLQNQKRFQELEKKIHLMKYLNSLENSGKNSSGFQIDEHLSKFEQDVKELNDFLTDRLKPVIKYEKEGLQLLKSSKWDDALAIFEKASTFDDQYIKLYAWKAKALRHKKEFENALIYLQKGLEISKNDPDLLREYGNLLGDQKNYQDALENFEKSLQFDPENLEALTQKGGCLLGLKKNQEAEIYFNQILKNKQIDKSYYDSLLGLGLSLLRQNKFDKASVLYKQAIQVNDCAEAHVSYGNCLGQMYNDRLHLYYDTVQSEYDQAIKLDANCISAYLAKANLLFKRPGRIPPYQTILDTLDEILMERDKENPKALIMKGTALCMSERFGDANVCLKIVIEKIDVDSQNKIAAIYQLMTMWMNRADRLKEFEIQQVFPLLKLIKQINEKDSIKFNQQCLENLGECLFKNKYFNEAAEVYQEVIRQHDCDYYIWNLECRSLFQAERYQEAIKLFDEIKGKNITMDAWTIIIKGDTLFGQNKFEEALQAYEIMINYNSEDKSANNFIRNQDPFLTGQKYFKFSLYSLILQPVNQLAPIKYYEKVGCVLLKQNKYTEALESFRQFIKEIETYQKIDRNLNDLQQEQLQLGYFNPSFAYINISKVLLQLNNNSEALETLQKIQQPLLPKKLLVEFYQIMSNALRNLNRQEEAQKWEQEAFKKGLNIQNVNISREQSLNAQTQSWQEKVNSLIKLNKFDEARTLYVEGVRANPKLLDNYLNQCEMLLEGNEFAQLIKWIEEAININPKIEKIYAIQNILKNRINNLIYDQKYDDALALLDMAHEQSKEIGINEILKSENWYYKIGFRLLQAADYPKAEQAFSSYMNHHELKNDNDYLNATFFLGLTLYKQSTFDQTLKHIEQLENIADLNNLPQQVQILKGDSLYRKGSFAEAAQVYQDASKLKSDPQRYIYNINMGDSLFESRKSKKDSNKVIQAYDKALKEGKSHNDKECINKALLHKGHALFHDEQYNEASKIFEELIQNDPTRTTAYYYQSKTLEKLEKSSEAQNILDLAHKKGLQINDETIPKLIKIIALSSDNVQDIKCPFK